MNKVIITGFGRSGTSFLIQLFSHLKMDTGFSPDVKLTYIDSNCGLEQYVSNNKHEIIKNGRHYTFINKVDKTDHIIIPIRDIDDSVNSRIKIKKEFNNIGGGTWREKDYKESSFFKTFLNLKNLNDFQKNKIYNLSLFYDLIHYLVKNDIPYTLLCFPDFIYDSNYLYDKLNWLFTKHKINKKEFLDKFNNLADKNKLHF